MKLATLGVREVFVITGFGRQEVVDEIEKIRDDLSIDIREIFNPGFTQGSLVSFNVSLPELERCAQTQASALLMDADVLYPLALLERLIASPRGTVLLVDRDYSRADTDPVLVPVRDGRPVDFVKCWQGEADVVGESIGFFKVHPTEIPVLLEETKKRIRAEAFAEPYEEVLRAMVLARHFHVEDTTGLPWIEIDFSEDVKAAENEILPAIERLDLARASTRDSTA
jgi:choline kinase